MKKAKPKREYIKILRSSIAMRARQIGWDLDYLHDRMDDWGFGRSLRKLSVGELRDILDVMNNVKAPSDLTYGIGELDAQGKYMWALMQDAGWNFMRLRRWMLKHCSASHWNALDQNEKRAVIAMLKKYNQGDPS